ncbi:hypothetical protein ACPOL_2966 [Acidisarcina polymorpha]|uniref:Uncharacterized protein n=1 Tax=Acidisarcina polymorpha TaxID=2211140 RepID=A0A2Z5FZI2_9BACT|nr:hypothetical protein ACPOL_2966 [Acidisarcina polymorpha]
MQVVNTPGKRIAFYEQSLKARWANRQLIGWSRLCRLTRKGSTPLLI